MLVDISDEEGIVGRSSADAPEIDGSVFLAANPDVRNGDMIRVRIREADEYDLYAELIS